MTFDSHGAKDGKLAFSEHYIQSSAWSWSLIIKPRLWLIGSDLELRPKLSDDRVDLEDPAYKSQIFSDGLVSTCRRFSQKESLPRSVHTPGDQERGPHSKSQNTIRLRKSQTP